MFLTTRVESRDVWTGPGLRCLIPSSLIDHVVVAYVLPSTRTPCGSAGRNASELLMET